MDTLAILPAGSDDAGGQYRLQPESTLWRACLHVLDRAHPAGVGSIPPTLEDSPG